MLSKENNKKALDYYKKTALSISSKIFNTLVEQESEHVVLMSELEDFSSDAINCFAKVFITLIDNEKEGEFSNGFVEATRNVFRDKLLNLSGKTDLIPDEELVNFCCKQSVALIYYTDKLQMQDES